jgi:hypothetical protein
MMRLHNILFAILVLGFTAGYARAEKVSFMGDFAAGVTIPISDNDYKNFADPSFKLSLKAGAIFYVSRYFGVSAEGQFDWIPVNTNDNNYQNRSIDASFNRIRFLGGSRFIIPFGIGSFYVRIALGLDYLTGSFTYKPAGVVVGSQSSSSTAFTFEPGFGVQFNVVRHLVLGIYTGFPIDSDQTITFAAGGGGALTSTFKPVDVDILGVVGIRF